MEDKTGVYSKISQKNILKNNDEITFGNIEFNITFPHLTNPIIDNTTIILKFVSGVEEGNSL